MKRPESMKGFDVIEIDFCESKLTIYYTYSAGSEGRYFGRPEDCYEGEPPEVTIEGIYIGENDISFLMQFDNVFDLIYNQIYDEVCAEKESEYIDQEPDYEY